MAEQEEQQQPLIPNSYWAGEEAVFKAFTEFRREKPMCFVCSAFTGVLFACLLWMLLRVSTASCTVESFNVHWVLPEVAAAAKVEEKFERATEQNTNLTGLDLDLLGVWWMDGNPLIQEQLVSFAGSHGSPPYPTVVKVPFSNRRHWSWSDSFVGRFIVAYYALTEPATPKHEFEFANNSYANIVPLADVFDDNNIFGFSYLGKNEWDRVDTYILRRVVYGNGTATPFWDEFLNWYTNLFPNGRIIVQVSDNQCLRRCQYFLLCSMCNLIC
mmetsp:Transcript_100468/g.199493  ORF Transcript_100468/g.199493 Transcript_100468/m.199493 type:complete len:271 (-) Transcript_100468:273-1085(-)